MTEQQRVIIPKENSQFKIYARGDRAVVLKENQNTFEIRFLTGKFAGRVGEVYKVDWEECKS